MFDDALSARLVMVSDATAERQASPASLLQDLARARERFAPVREQARLSDLAFDVRDVFNAAKLAGRRGRRRW